jgi:hypothetical protein
MACLLFGKDASAKPFRNDDFVLVRAVLPHISHGLDVAAMQSDYDPCGLDESEPFASSELGVVLVDQSGKVRAVNNRASGIFAQIGVFERLPFDVQAASQVEASFAFVAKALRSVFF